MKYVLLLVLPLLLSSGPAYAEWVRLNENEEGTTVYVDPDTIRRKGDRVKMWELYDYKTALNTASGPSSSNRQQSEYDCPEERTRTLAAQTYSGNMLSGKFLKNYTFDEDQWQPIPPGTLGQALWQFACSKK